MEEKHWQGEVNGVVVEFHRHEDKYVAEVFPFAKTKLTEKERWYFIRIMVTAFGLSPATVNWSALGSQDIETTKRFAEALDAAWRIAAGINEELGIKNHVDAVVWTVKPDRFGRKA